MRKMGLEPTRYCYHKILSLARLPIPTLPHSDTKYYYLASRKNDNNIFPRQCQHDFKICRNFLYT